MTGEEWGDGTSDALVRVALGEEPPDTVVADATVFDAVTGEFTPGRSVWVKDGRIARVVEASESVPPGAETLDASGLTLVPGLMDGHQGKAGGVQRLCPGRNRLRSLNHSSNPAVLNPNRTAGSEFPGYRVKDRGVGDHRIRGLLPQSHPDQRVTCPISPLFPRHLSPCPERRSSLRLRKSSWSMSPRA